MAKTKATTVPGIDIGIPEKDRKAIAEGLLRLLADTYTLYLRRPTTTIGTSRDRCSRPCTSCS